MEIFVGFRLLYITLTRCGPAVTNLVYRSSCRRPPQSGRFIYGLSYDVDGVEVLETESQCVVLIQTCLPRFEDWHAHNKTLLLIRYALIRAYNTV